MKYRMFVVAGQGAAAEAEPSPDDLAIEQWLAEVQRRGQRVTGAALRPPSEAVTVRVSHGQVLVTDAAGTGTGPEPPVAHSEPVLLAARAQQHLRHRQAHQLGIRQPLRVARPALARKEQRGRHHLIGPWP